MRYYFAVVITCSKMGRIIYTGIFSNNYLNEMERKIVLYICRYSSTECERGTYGANCEDDCGHCTDITQCDIKNGHCGTGCETWYTTDVCKVYIGTWCEP